MKLSLLITWLPILLGVGMGGRILGRTRGLGVGVVAALFWLLLVQITVGPAVWLDWMTLASALAGAAAIVAMGAWSGEIESPRRPVSQPQAIPAPRPETPPADAPGVAALASAMDQFRDWLDRHSSDDNPWPYFDELIRSVLHECCRAAHVRPYRLADDGRTLQPLRAENPHDDADVRDARAGVLGHVAMSGQSFHQGDPSNGDLLRQLLEQSDYTPAWCFAISHGHRRLGVVGIGRVDLDVERHRPLLRAAERLVQLFWVTLEQARARQQAVLHEPVTGVLSRQSFFAAAETALQASYQRGEPVALAVIAVEGLRQLNDACRWEVADGLLREVSNVLRSKLRNDDRIGRFDGSRFIVLLRRVDSQLASLIVSQVMRLLSTRCGEDSPCGKQGATIRVRCGVAGSGLGRPDLATLAIKAVEHCQQARLDHTPIASDLTTEAVAQEVGA